VLEDSVLQQMKRTKRKKKGADELGIADYHGWLLCD
jgi:hypothetical protein